MTDSDFLLALLATGPKSQAEILSASFNERGCGLTIHSRASDLRKRGHDIRCVHVPGRARGHAYVYSLRKPHAGPEGCGSRSEEGVGHSAVTSPGSLSPELVRASSSAVGEPAATAPPAQLSLDAA